MSKQTNTLLILMDQWGGKRIGVAGNEFIQTPTLDQLAKNGTLYTNAYSEVPFCIPARRSLYTGTSSDDSNSSISMGASGAGSL